MAPSSEASSSRIPGQRPPPTKVNNDGFTTLACPDAPGVDIIFIHGLQGHPERSWIGTNTANKKVFWPLEALPEDRPDVRVMTYGYDSRISRGPMQGACQMNISEQGRAFLSNIVAQRRNCQGRPLVIVAHSLGGLITKRALIDSWRAMDKDIRSVWSATRGIMFFGTPHRGSNDAAWLELAGRVALIFQVPTHRGIIHELDPGQRSSTLESLREDFCRMYQANSEIKGFSFLENRGKPGPAFLNSQVCMFSSA